MPNGVAMRINLANKCKDKMCLAQRSSISLLVIMILNDSYSTFFPSLLGY